MFEPGFGSVLVTWIVIAISAVGGVGLCGALWWMGRHSYRKD